MLRRFMLCMLASAAALGLPSASAVAGSFSVSPVRIDLDAGSLAGADDSPRAAADASMHSVSLRSIVAPISR